MSENNFAHDLCFGKQYYPLLELLFKRYYYEGRYVFIDKSRFSDLVQKRLHVDMMAQVAVEESAGVEIKVVRWPASGIPHHRFCLETRSCTNPGYESPGWMKTGKADFLLYAFVIDGLGLDTYLINFPLLQPWFWTIVQNHPDKWYTQVMRTGNRTESKLVPISEVIEAIPTVRFLVRFNGSIQQLDLHSDISVLRNEVLYPQLKERIDTLLKQIPEEPVEYEDNAQDEEGNWRDVQQRVEEILAVQELEDFLQWVDKIEQSSLWNDET